MVPQFLTFTFSRISIAYFSLKKQNFWHTWAQGGYTPPRAQKLDPPKNCFDVLRGVELSPPRTHFAM